MEYVVLLVGNLIALVAAAIALGTPRINAAIASRSDEEKRRLEDLDAFALRVRALSKQIQTELAFPHLPTLRTVDPVHDLLYASPALNPDSDSLSEILQIGQRARELNYGPWELLLWPFRSGERHAIVRQLVAAEARFVANYWSARDQQTATRSWIGKLRMRIRRHRSASSG